MIELLSLVGIAVWRCLLIYVVVCDVLDATHIPFGKTDLDLLPGSSFSLLDSPLQIVSVAVLYCSLSPHLNAAFCSFSSAWTSSVVQGSMFGKTLIYFLMHVDDSSRTSAHTCTHSQNHTLRLKEH